MLHPMQLSISYFGRHMRSTVQDIVEHTCTPAHTDTSTHACARSLSCTRMHARMHACTHAHTHAFMHTRAYTFRARAHARTQFTMHHHRIQYSTVLGKTKIPNGPSNPFLVNKGTACCAADHVQCLSQCSVQHNTLHSALCIAVCIDSYSVPFTLSYLYMMQDPMHAVEHSLQSC